MVCVANVSGNWLRCYFGVQQVQFLLIYSQTS